MTLPDTGVIVPAESADVSPYPCAYQGRRVSLRAALVICHGWRPRGACEPVACPDDEKADRQMWEGRL